MMKNSKLVWLLVFLVGFLASVSCMDRKPAPVCPVPTEIRKSKPTPAGFEGVDILVVVDNSASMASEQKILATSFFPLINSLVNPVEGSAASRDIRIGITTSDMGLQHDGVGYDKDKYPLPSHYIAKCLEPLGNNGKLVTGYTLASGGTADIQEGVILCNDTAEVSQCPPGWDCVNPANGIGTCEDLAGDGTLQSCPPSPKEKNRDYVDLATDGGWSLSNLAFTTACLATVGTEGCSFEQQLVAGATGLDASDFVRENSLTAIIIVSDEEDCSIKSPKLFSSPEFSPNANTVNTVCGENSEFLYDVAEIKKMYDDKKNAISGKNNAILFAAIVGAPDEKGSACQGTGNELDKCLEMELSQGGTMEHPQIIDHLDKDGKVTGRFYEYACERYSEDDSKLPLTQAYPGTRYVELAQAYGDMGYVYSICNRDWSPAMEKIAGLISENLSGACYPKRLGWSPATETAKCNVVFDYKMYDSSPSCPTDDGQEWIEPNGRIKAKGVNEDGKTFHILSCTAQKLAVPRRCGDKASEYENDLDTFGWFYCENDGENNWGACDDKKDNDNDGAFDCDDDECKACSFCEDESLHDSAKCPLKCPYMVSMTPSAMSEARRAVEISIECLQEFKFEDLNCQENSKEVCSDGYDNDGNGPFDCVNVSRDDATDDNPARNADPSCCPMNKDESGNCVFLNPDGSEGSGWKEICDVDNVPDACREAASVLGCILN